MAWSSVERHIRDLVEEVIGHPYTFNNKDKTARRLVWTPTYILKVGKNQYQTIEHTKKEFQACAEIIRNIIKNYRGINVEYRTGTRMGERTAWGTPDTIIITIPFNYLG
jgi:hypothetical protein